MAKCEGCGKECDKTYCDACVLESLEKIQTYVDKLPKCRVCNEPEDHDNPMNSDGVCLSCHVKQLEELAATLRWLAGKIINDDIRFTDDGAICLGKPCFTRADDGKIVSYKGYEKKAYYYVTGPAITDFIAALNELRKAEANGN